VSASATFACAACGGTAAVVTLLSPGDPLPDVLRRPPGAADPVLLGRDVLGDRTWLVIAGGPVSKAVSVLPADEIAAALERADAAALHAVDAELAPFWCPACGAAYCADHYRSWVTFDDGFYDATYGECPAGHERMLDD